MLTKLGRFAVTYPDVARERQERLAAEAERTRQATLTQAAAPTPQINPATQAAASSQEVVELRGEVARLSEQLAAMTTMMQRLLALQQTH